MIINTNKIEELIFSESISAYSIEKETGVSRMTITNYRNGVSDFENMTLTNAMKLQELINKLEEENIMTTFEVWAINQHGDEYLEDAYNTLEEATKAAQDAWDRLSSYDQKNQRIEVRTDMNDMGYDVPFVLGGEFRRERK